MTVKHQAKRLLLRLGLWGPVEKLRDLRCTRRWVKAGCSGPAPNSLKMQVVRSYLDKYSLDLFLETGTYLGDTLGYIAETGVKCSSIEISPELYASACERFKRQKNVRVFHGDSGTKLPELLRDIDRPCLFWLDGHYSAGVTSRADVDTPISKELEAIFDHPIKGHIILIDDARYFNGTNSYPHIDQLLAWVRREGTYIAEVSADIVRLVPRGRPA